MHIRRKAKRTLTVCHAKDIDFGVRGLHMQWHELFSRYGKELNFPFGGIRVLIDRESSRKL
jgi:hypothetical protein